VNEKPLDFRKWWFEQGVKCPNDIGSIAEQTWVAARVGMVPADEAIVIPPESEWPDDSELISVSFMRKNNVVMGNMPEFSITKVIQVINRPKEKCIPTPGCPIFIKEFGTYCIYTFSSYCFGKEECRVFGFERNFLVSDIKLATTELRGEDWEAIP
jgi:hypothetical protein